MNLEKLEEILNNISHVKMGIFGDFCLDGAWKINLELSENSRETGLQTNHICLQNYTPGAAFNIAKNLRDLGVKEILPITVIGDGEMNDPFYYPFHKWLEQLNIHSKYILEDERRTTPVFVKPLKEEKGKLIEQERYDLLGNFPIDEKLEKKLKENISECLEEVDAIILNDQIEYGVMTMNIVDFVNELAGKSEKPFIADSRYKIGKFENIITKPNEKEAAEVFGKKISEQNIIEGSKIFAKQLYNRTKKPVFITLGKKGAVIYDGFDAKHIPAVSVRGQIDACGAGDTFISALTSSLTVGATLKEAAELGNLASAVTIQKLNTTGTASPEEIREIAEDYLIN